MVEPLLYTPRNTRKVGEAIVAIFFLNMISLLSKTRFSTKEKRGRGHTHLQRKKREKKANCSLLLLLSSASCLLLCLSLHYGFGYYYSTLQSYPTSPPTTVPMDTKKITICIVCNEIDPLSSFYTSGTGSSPCCSICCNNITKPAKKSPLPLSSELLEEECQYSGPLAGREYKNDEIRILDTV